MGHDRQGKHSFPSGYYAGSGVLIDPLHVLTAGHAVYNHDENGGSGAWASEIAAVPAYANGAEPYGRAIAGAVNIYCWTGWTEDQNWGHDMAVIALDEPIGFSTGWYGYGYKINCSFFAGNSFYDVGYPGEAPYYGKYMYYRYGSFDSCATYILYFNAPSLPGQSGSGQHREYQGARTVYSVLSHGAASPPYYTGCTRITSGKYSDIASFIAGNTPSTCDLIGKQVEITPSSVEAGGQLSSLSYLVHNHSSASWSGTVEVDVYLSENDIISTDDTHIQSHSFTHDFGANSSYQVNVAAPPMIPAATGGGNYWIGVILEVSDHQTGNNDTSGDDAFSIAVIGNTDPQLCGGLASPDIGAPETDFYWHVDYYDADGDAPAIKEVYIDDKGYAMSLYFGAASDGAYRYGPMRLSEGSHNYYYNFTDGNGGRVRLPVSGAYAGPLLPCIVNLPDLFYFMKDWRVNAGDPPGDLSGDGRVDLCDYNILARYWLGLCPDGWPWWR